MSSAWMAGAAGIGSLLNFHSARQQRKLAKRNAALSEEQWRHARARDDQLWGEFNRTALPTLRGLADSADITPAQRSSYLGQAALHVDSAYDATRGRMGRALDAFGRGGLSTGALREVELARAASKAGALTATERALDEAAFDRQLRAGSLLGGLLGGGGRSSMLAGQHYGNLSAQHGAAAGHLYATAGQNLGQAIGHLADWYENR